MEVWVLVIIKKMMRTMENYLVLLRKLFNFTVSSKKASRARLAMSQNGSPPAGGLPFLGRV